MGFSSSAARPFLGRTFWSAMVRVLLMVYGDNDTIQERVTHEVRATSVTGGNKTSRLCSWDQVGKVWIIQNSITTPLVIIHAKGTCKRMTDFVNSSAPSWRHHLINLCGLNCETVRWRITNISGAAKCFVYNIFD